jgi:hypothetical protein
MAKAYTSTTSDADGAVTEATVYGDTPRGRSLEFARGVDHLKTDTPAPPVRRAGPLPYPETYDDHVQAQAEREWSRGS